MKFIVIENQRGDLDSLILVLKHAFPSAEIVTKPGEVVNLWSSAVNCVSKELESKELIVFTDIALDDNSSADAQAGLEQIRRVFAIKPDATWIAFTSFTEVVESEEAGEIFHAVLSKQKFNKPRKIHERAQYVAKIVQSGIGKSTGSSSCVFSANDSLGMRTFLAVFSRFALEEIILAECQGWTGVVVSALSAGYSGASLLALRGSLSGVMRRIVVKVAARADTIERETKILTEFFGEAQEFSRRCASAQPLKPLPRGLGYYSIQEAVAGETLFSVINDDQSVKSSAVRSILKAIVDVELVQSGAAINLLDEKEHRKRRIGLLPVDIDRIKKSCSELRGMASCLKHDGGWPSTDVDPELLFRNIEVTALNWNEALDNLPPLLWVLQHGDLNPHNVIVGELGQPLSLIWLGWTDGLSAMTFATFNAA
ncbi:phosphotransferase [Verrucomicrobium spinosum]|uniref:phosphotransferase n=1 Tax=Verrucomicrobium spinosum TaxID=2736 RepID=UPI0009463849|nr:phosphotransferase [Verrucomicrobium spinosum]